MGVRLTTSEDRTALFDSVTGFAFGPTFSTEEDAAAFLEFIGGDGRDMADRDLEDALSRFRDGRPEAWPDRVQQPWGGNDDD